MEESILVITNVDEGGFQTWVEVLDAAFVDPANHATIRFTLNFEAVEGAVNEERDTLLERL